MERIGRTSAKRSRLVHSMVLRTNERRGGQLADDGCSRAVNPGSVKVRETAWAWERWTGWSAKGSAGKALVER